jgi:riboflavin kinase/FMN adenylyltransferase
LFDFHGDLYGKSVRVSLLRFLREERKFETVQELEQQIAADVQRAVSYHWE